MQRKDMCKIYNVPFRPVAPEQASRASKITIDGIGRPWRSLSSMRWWAIAAPEYPAPIITISVSEGSVPVLRCESMGLVVFLQYDGVERAVGKGPGGDMSGS
jgi:hypothetical protein